MTRKELVHKLAEHLEVAPAYLGAPSFAYQVGDYTVDRHSNILDTQGREVGLEELLTGTAPETEVEATQETASETEEPVALEIGLRWRPSRKSLRNLIHTIYSKQLLIKKALGLETDLVSRSITALAQEPMASGPFRKAMEALTARHDFDFEKNYYL